MNRISLLSFLVFTSCASISNKQAFESVQTEVSETTGYTINWTDRDSLGLDESLHKSDTLSLDLAIKTALGNSPKLQVILEEFGVRQAEFIQQSSLPNPRLKGDILFPLTQGGMREFGIDLGGELIKFLQAPRLKKLRASTTKRNQHDLAQTLLGQIAEIHQAYAEVVFSTRSRQHVNELYLLSAAGLETAEQMVAAGNLSSSDMMHLNIEMQDAKINLKRFDLELSEAKSYLSLLLGQNEIDKTLILESAAFSPMEADEDNYLRNALDKNHHIKARIAELEAMGENARVENLDSYLSNLHAGIVLENHDEIWSLGPELEISIPIFNRGKAKREALKSQFNLAEAILKDESLKIRHVLSSLHKRSKVYAEMVADYKKSMIGAMEKVTEGQLQNFNAMQIGVFELIEAKRSEFESMLEMASLEKELWMARSNLELSKIGYHPGLGQSN